MSEVDAFILLGLTLNFWAIQRTARRFDAIERRLQTIWERMIGLDQ